MRAHRPVSARSLPASGGAGTVHGPPLEAAELAHYLAAQAPAIDSEEAFLCGLLHDIGKLPIDRLNLFDSATMRGLLHHGCPPVCADRVGLCPRSTGVTEHSLEAWNNGREPLAMTA